MAARNESTWSDVIECPICTEVMSDPRALPCQHTFCLKCIARNGKRQEQPTCPICRKGFSVANKIYSNLPKNFYIAKLLDAKRHMDKESRRKEDEERKTKSKLEQKQPANHACILHPDKPIQIHCNTCRVDGCIACLKFHKSHSWNEIPGESDMKAIVRTEPHNHANDDRVVQAIIPLVQNEIIHRIRAQQLIIHSLERIQPLITIAERDREERDAYKTMFGVFAIVIIFIGAFCYHKINIGSPNMIHPEKIHQDYDALVSCKLGSHLISCNNGFPVDTMSCRCQDVAKDGAKCRAICTKNIISNFEIILDEIGKVGKPVRIRCSHGNVVLGCHVWPVLDMLPEDSVYFPSDDGKSCNYHGLPGTHCIATCGVADAQHYEVLKQSGTGNISVSCPENSRVFGCGVSPYMRVETRMTRRSAIDAHLRSCQCSDTDLTTYYAICGRW